MTVAENHDASDQGERPSWAWPVHAFVAWLARLFTYIANFKRARRFKPDWRNSWQDLRECEWLRDQLIAQGLAQLLAGEPLHLDDTKIDLTPPAAYGGPCPRTPFEMNRRFLAIAQWAADPEAIIRERFRRVAASGRFASGPFRHASRATFPSFAGAGPQTVGSVVLPRREAAGEVARSDGGGRALARGLSQRARGPPLRNGWSYATTSPPPRG